MLHSRGELLLMLDADGATKVNDLEKLGIQVGSFIYLLKHPLLRMKRLGFLGVLDASLFS